MSKITRSPYCRERYRSGSDDPGAESAGMPVRNRFAMRITTSHYD
ncbi:hypothetical protein ACNKHV_00440 [Shigella flexneri]